MRITNRNRKNVLKRRKNRSKSKMAEQMSKKRIKNKLLILLVMLTFSVLLMLVKNAMLDQIICIMIVDIVFYAILSFLLENERISGRISSNKTTDFRRIQNAVALASATAFLCGLFSKK